MRIEVCGTIIVLRWISPSPDVHYSCFSLFIMFSVLRVFHVSLSSNCSVLVLTAFPHLGFTWFVMYILFYTLLYYMKILDDFICGLFTVVTVKYIIYTCASNCAQSNFSWVGNQTNPRQSPSGT